MAIRRLEDITVGARRREDLGDIDGLMESLRRFGLLHPIVIDAHRVLVAGGRRFEAARRLGWDEIETTDIGELTEDQRREIELEENLRRKDLTDYERSRNLAALGQVARVVQRREAEQGDGTSEPRRWLVRTQQPKGSGEEKLGTGVIRSAEEEIGGEFRSESERNSPRGRGRPTAPDSYRAIADRIGVPAATLILAEQHVAAVERYPELEPLAQRPAIDAAKALDELPESQREQTRAAITALTPEERRRRARERAQAEQAESDRLLALVGDPEGKLARAGLLIAYNKAEQTVRRTLLALDAVTVAGIFDREHWVTAKLFLRDMRAWLDALEQAQVVGPRLMKGNEHDE